MWFGAHDIAAARPRFPPKSRGFRQPSTPRVARPPTPALKGRNRPALLDRARPSTWKEPTGAIAEAVAEVDPMTQGYGSHHRWINYGLLWCRVKVSLRSAPALRDLDSAHSTTYLAHSCNPASMLQIALPGKLRSALKKLLAPPGKCPSRGLAVPDTTLFARCREAISPSGEPCSRLALASTRPIFLLKLQEGVGPVRRAPEADAFNS